MDESRPTVLDAEEDGTLTYLLIMSLILAPSAQGRCVLECAVSETLCLEMEARPADHSASQFKALSQRPSPTSPPRAVSLCDLLFPS